MRNLSESINPYSVCLNPYNVSYNLIYKINKERRRSMNTTPPLTRTSGQEPRRTPNKNRTGHKADHGQDNHFNNTLKELIVSDKEIKHN
jgi:hypothetical protein